MERELVDVHEVDAASDPGGMVATFVVEAAQYLASYRWGSDFQSMHFGCAVRGLLGVFLVRLREPVGNEHDARLWVVAGHAPAAHLVPDRAPTPLAALGIYLELANDWIDAARTNGEPTKVFPFRQPLSAGQADVFAESLRAAKDVVERERDGEAVPGLIRAADCPRRLLTPVSEIEGGIVATGFAGSPGDLVLDHRSAPALLHEPAPRPDGAWLKLQRDPRMRERADDRWWRLLPLSGGAMQVPESLISVVGKPSAEHIELALRNANEFGRQILRRLPGAPR